MDSGVKLIIKAPNQNIDDQVIHCPLDWSVIRLKEHLSIVYPNKPDVQDQKLIYSGRLLRDQMLLNEGLRHDDCETSVYTLHLVCSRTNSVLNSVPPQSSQNTVQPSTSGTNNDPGTDSDRSGVRQRHVGSSTSTDVDLGSSSDESSQHTLLNSQTNQMPQMQQTYSTYLYPHSNVPSPVTSYNMAAQMAAYQQMYANYYAQIMQNMQPVPGVNPVPVVPGPQTAVPVIEQRNAAAQAPGLVQNQNIRLNAQGVPLLNDNDDGANRDWLDYFYLCCRGFVLFSIVYFYSSPERLLLVIGCMVLAFLYQEGWLIARTRNNLMQVNPENREGQPNNNQNDTDDAVPQNQNPADSDHAEEHEIEAIMDGDNPPIPPVQNPPQIPTPNAAWTFITSFFSSLIPEPPPAVIN